MKSNNPACHTFSKEKPESKVSKNHHSQQAVFFSFPMGDEWPRPQLERDPLNQLSAILESLIDVACAKMDEVSCSAQEVVQYHTTYSQNLSMRVYVHPHLSCPNKGGIGFSAKLTTTTRRLWAQALSTETIMRSLS